MKKFIGLLLVLCLFNFLLGLGGGGADTAEFPDIYVDEGVGGTHVGSIANPYDDISDINWTTGGDNSIFDWYAGVEDASVRIHLNRGDTWRELLLCGASGSVAYPIIIQPYGAGVDPIILGSEEVIGVGGDWTDETGDVWSRALATECKTVTFDSTHYGTEDATPDDDYEWDWVANELFVYSVGNPTGVYTSIEAGQRNYCINQSTKDYMVFDNITCKYANVHGINMISRNTLTISNCTTQYNRTAGIFIQTATGAILIDGCTVQYNGNPGIQLRTIQSASSLIVSNNEISNNAQSGGYGHEIDMADTDDALITTNTIHDSALHSGIGGDGYQNCTYEYNTIYNCYYHGIDLTADTDADRDCNSNIVRYNLIYDCVGADNCSGVLIFTHEVEARHANNNQVYYNIFYGNTYGVTVTGQCDSNEIYNNTFYDHNRGINITHAGNTAFFPSNTLVKNNIVYTVDAGDRHLSTNHVDASNDLDHNCYYPDQADCIQWDTVLYATFALYQAASGGEDANSIDDDPLFINGAGQDFRLLMASLCINAGTDVGLTRDYRGRSIRHAPDIGAYEDPTNAIFMAKLFKYLKERK